MVKGKSFLITRCSDTHSNKFQQQYQRAEHKLNTFSHQFCPLSPIPIFILFIFLRMTQSWSRPSSIIFIYLILPLLWPKLFCQPLWSRKLNEILSVEFIVYIVFMKIVCQNGWNCWKLLKLAQIRQQKWSEMRDMGGKLYGKVGFISILETFPVGVLGYFVEWLFQWNISQDFCFDILEYILSPLQTSTMNW